MHTKKLLFAVLIGTLCAPAFAADIGDDQAARVDAMPHGGASPDDLRLAAPLARQEKVVKNAPYSAEAISERLQNLADGNQISQRMSMMNYRDNSGRTRQEGRYGKVEAGPIIIRDGEGSTWFLNPQDKTAVLISMKTAAEVGRQAGEAARARIEQWRKEGKLASVEHRGPNGEEIVVKRIERVEGEPGKNLRENVRIQVNPAPAQATAGRELANGLTFAGAFGDSRWSSKATTRELGTKEIEGVKAEGKLRSYEIPAGEAGNRNPIVVSDETWYAPDLQVTVLTKHSDPRSGDTIYRLTNIKREEPPAALFTVPADYTVKDALKDAMSKVVIEKKTP